MAIAKSITSPRRLHMSLVILMGLLVIQFVVGMYLNFYAHLPDTHPGTSGSFAPSIPWAISGGAGIALAIHVANWLLITVGAIGLLVRSIIGKAKTYIIGTAIGLLFILMAGSGGLAFLNRGGEDRESMMMALGFILALTTYAITFYQTRQEKTAPS